MNWGAVAVRLCVAVAAAGFIGLAAGYTLGGIVGFAATAGAVLAYNANRTT